MTTSNRTSDRGTAVENAAEIILKKVLEKKSQKFSK
jgi:hypothetical protein